MKRVSAVMIAILFAGACALQAQDANPISANLKKDWANIRDLLTKMADKMPDEDYRFKPTPEIQDFGQRMAHIANANLHACTDLDGQRKNATFSPMPTKAEVVAAIKQANDECDSFFSTLTDAGLMKMVNGRGGQRMELAVIQGNLLEHSQEMYGYMSVYLRLKGIVPPSSDRNER